MLKLLEAAGEIKLIQCQAQVELTAARIVYKPDFKCERNGETYYVEAKGFETPEWRIKKRLWEYYGPAPLEIWGGSYASPKHLTTIYPEAIPSP